MVKNERKNGDISDGKRFTISIVLNLVAMILLTSLILLIHLPINVGVGVVLISNFFYNSVSAIVVDIWFSPNMGFGIFLPIIMICLYIAGTTMLVRNFERTKKLILINQLTYIIPIIGAIISAIRLSNIHYSLNVSTGWFNTWYIGFLPLMLHLPFQVNLLLKKQSFAQWNGSSNTLTSVNTSKKTNTKRKWFSSIMLNFYLCNYLAILIYIINSYFIVKHFWIIFIPYVLYILWWILGELIYKNKLFSKDMVKLET